jgi:hypothetical protein
LKLQSSAMMACTLSRFHAVASSAAFLSLGIDPTVWPTHWREWQERC